MGGVGGVDVKREDNKAVENENDADEDEAEVEQDEDEDRDNLDKAAWGKDVETEEVVVEHDDEEEDGGNLDKVAWGKDVEEEEEDKWEKASWDKEDDGEDDDILDELGRTRIRKESLQSSDLRQWKRWNAPEWIKKPLGSSFFVSSTISSHSTSTRSSMQ